MKPLAVTQKCHRYSASYNKVFSFHHQLPTVGTSVRKKAFCVSIKIFPFINFPGSRYISLRFEQKSPDFRQFFSFIINFPRSVHEKNTFSFRKNFSFTAFYQNPAVHEKNKNIIIGRAVLPVCCCMQYPKN